MQQFACEKAGQTPQALLVFDLLDNLFTNPDNEIPKENHWKQITPDKHGKIYHFFTPFHASTYQRTRQVFLRHQSTL